jgi:hypothetical protein
LHQEVERPVVDVVGDRSAEGLGGLAAEHDVEAGLLTWWDHLRERAALLQFGVLVHQEPDVNVLPQVIGDDEALGGRGLHEDCLEVDLLRASVDLLELLARELDAAVPHFGLGLRLGLPLPLDDPVLVSLSTMPEACQISLSRLVAIDWLLDVEEIDLSGQS